MKTTTRTFFLIALVTTLCVSTTGICLAQISSANQPGFNPQLMSGSVGGGVGGLSGGPLNDAPILSSAPGSWGGTTSSSFSSSPMSGLSTTTLSSTGLSQPNVSSPISSSSSQAVSFGGTNTVGMAEAAANTQTKHQTENRNPTPVSGNVGNIIPQPVIHVVH